MKNALRKITLLTIWICLCVLNVQSQYTWDQSFGNNGEVVQGGAEVINIIETYDDKKFIISQTGFDLEFPFIARLTKDGTPDSSFHEDGGLVQWLSTNRRIVDMAMQPDITFFGNTPDKRFVTLYQGNEDSEIKNDLLLRRFLDDGEPDSTWGTLGSLQISPPATDIYEYEYHGITSHALGNPKFVIIGIRRSNQRCDEIFAFGLDEDGNMDTNFGENGFAVLDLNSIANSDYPSCAFTIKNVKEEGGLIMASLQNPNGESSICFARASSNGEVDSTSLDTIQIDDSIDYELIGGVFFVNNASLFEGFSNKLFEPYLLFTWMIPVVDGNQVSILRFDPIVNNSFTKIELNLNTDAQYNDMALLPADLSFHFTGQKNSSFIISSATICNGEVIVESTEMDFVSNPEEGVFITNLHTENGNQDVLHVVSRDLNDNRKHYLKKVFFDYSCVSTSIDELDPVVSKFSVYPNPVRDGEIRLAMHLERSTDIVVSLTPLNSQANFNLANFSNQSGQLNETFRLPGDLASGIYLLKIALNDRVITEKLLVH